MFQVCIYKLVSWMFVYSVGISFLVFYLLSYPANYPLLYFSVLSFCHIFLFVFFLTLFLSVNLGMIQYQEQSHFYGTFLPSSKTVLTGHMIKLMMYFCLNSVLLKFILLFVQWLFCYIQYISFQYCISTVLIFNFSTFLLLWIHFTVQILRIPNSQKYELRRHFEFDL